jgi:hypothetical protein
VGKLLRGLLIVLAIVGAVVFVVILLEWVKPSDPTEKKDFIQAVGVLLAALAGLGGLYLTRQNTDKQLRQARESQEQAQRLTEQGQITERFTRAIDQLGATDEKGKKLETRLGGIYALERIDKESPDRAYHETVMEVLTAYVRENSRRDRGKSSTPTSAAIEAAEQDKGVEQDVEPDLQRPPADIQAILDVLKRREEERVPEKHRIFNIDLQGAFLQHAYLPRVNFRVAELWQANLQRAFLRKADLTDADLTEANLQRAYLNEADLSKARLRKADFTEAKLQGAKLQGAKLQGADLRGAKLQGADLRGADLRGALNLTQAQIEDALGNKDTKLPEGLQRPAEWSKGSADQTHGDE